MPALTTYDRLEATGLWRATPQDQRREVVVSIGDATLVIKDLTDKAITHRFYIRYIGGIGKDHVITHAGIRYRVKRAEDYQFRQQFLIIEVEQLGAI